MTGADHEPDRDVLFVGLTRPQMLLGVTYGYAIGNAIVTAVLLHLIGWVACLRDPRFFDLWFVKVQRCPRVRNYRLWRCNSYRP